MATSNPAFSQDIFAGYGQVYGVPRSTVTTVQGTMSKTFLLLAIMSATALWSWHALASDQLQLGVIPIAGIAGFILAMVTIFKPTVAPWTSPVYAAMEGVFLGAISQIVEMKFHKAYPGIALQAVMLTSGTLLAMLFVYANGIIRVTDRLKAGIVMATGAVCLFYFASIILRMFGVRCRSSGVRRSTASASACSWWGWRRSTCFSTSISSRRPPTGRCPSTWNGTGPSA